MRIPRKQMVALVRSLEHHAFGYTDDALDARAAFRRLAEWVAQHEDVDRGDAELVLRRERGDVDLSVSRPSLDAA